MGIIFQCNNSYVVSAKSNLGTRQEARSLIDTS